MTAVDTVLSTIGDVAAGVAAVAAVIGLRYARQTVREARAERWAGEQARLVRRLEWVGETIEHIDRLAEEDQRIRPQGETWRRGRNLLAQGFVGLAGLLPQTARLVDCADPYSARSMAMLAREEVAGELARLARRQGSGLVDAHREPRAPAPGLRAPQHPGFRIPAQPGGHLRDRRHRLRRGDNR
jgi:hypothetical protein